MTLQERKAELISNINISNQQLQQDIGALNEVERQIRELPVEIKEVK